MEAEELVKEAKSLGARVETVKRHCKKQKATSQNVFDYCPIEKQREFGINLGSAGGPAVVCKGHSLATGGSHKRTPTPEEKGMGLGEVIVIEYSEPKTCPFYIEGGIIGWKIFLPKRA